MKNNGVTRVSHIFPKIITISAVMLLTTGLPAFAQDEGNMDGDEINDMIDDLGGGSNASSDSGSSSGMSGMDGGSPNTVPNTTTASVPSTPMYNDFSTKANDFDHEADEEGGVDKEMSDSGEHESVSDRWNETVPDVSSPATPIPTGDRFNQAWDSKPSKKKTAKKAKKSKKGKIAKKSKKSKKPSKISKKSKKSKDRRIAGKSKNSKKRYR